MSCCCEKLNRDLKQRRNILCAHAKIIIADKKIYFSLFIFDANIDVFSIFFEFLIGKFSQRT
jgi:hypothetical protein